MCTLRPIALDRDKTLSPKTPVKMHMPHGRGAKTSSLKIIEQIGGFSSVHFSSVTQSCLTLCDPMNCSTPGLPVHQTQTHVPEFTQTHVHRVGDAIQPSHLLSGG